MVEVPLSIAATQDRLVNLTWDILRVVAVLAVLGWALVSVPKLIKDFKGAIIQIVVAMVGLLALVDYWASTKSVLGEVVGGTLAFLKETFA